MAQEDSSIGQDIADLIAAMIAEHNSHESEIDLHEVTREAICRINSKITALVKEVVAKRAS